MSDNKINEDTINLSEDDDESISRRSNSFLKKELNSISAISSGDDQTRVF